MMYSAIQWTDSIWLNCLSWTLIHFLWQAVGIAAVIYMSLSLVRRSSPGLRYGIACCGLLAMAILPLLTFAWYVNNASENGDGLAFRNQFGAFENLEPIHHDSLAIDAAGSVEAQSSALDGRNEFADKATANPAFGNLSRLDAVAPFLVAGWMCGVLFLGFRSLVGYCRVSQWRQNANLVSCLETQSVFQRLVERTFGRGQRLRVQLLESTLLQVPSVVGVLKPVVLIPPAMLTGLSQAQVEAILAHELAHIKRQDFLVNLLQTAVETILFYHPAVWWVSRQIRIEREYCCDDLAVEWTGDRKAFANALVTLEELRSEGIAMAANGGSLLARIQRLVRPEGTSQQVSSFASIVSVLVFMVVSSLIVSRAHGIREPAASHESILKKNTIATESESYSVSTATEDEEHTQRPVVLRETVKTDSKTNLEKRVFAGVELSQVGGAKCKLDMMYSNVSGHTFIPQRIARKLKAKVVGRVDFAKQKDKEYEFVPGNKNAEGLMLKIADLSIKKTKLSDKLGPNHPKIKSIEREIELWKTQMQRQAKPYVVDKSKPFNMADHLKTYGMNQIGQQEFEMVEIDLGDLGIGPKFGPLKALVLDDRNSDFGVLGRDWASKVKGKNGETLWFHFDGSLHFKARKANRNSQPKTTLPQVLRHSDEDGNQRAYVVSKRSGRSATEMFRHLMHPAINLPKSLEGRSATNMETIVAATTRYVVGTLMDADEMILNLPEGSKTRAEFTAKSIQITQREDHQEVVLTHGQIRWVDPVGVARVLVSADGGAELLTLHVRYVNHEVEMKIKARRLKPFKDDKPPVQVKMNLTSGDLNDESDPPHGSVRYGIELDKEKNFMRLKMKWRYEMKQLAEEAAAESGKSWKELLKQRR